MPETEETLCELACCECWITSPSIKEVSCPCAPRTSNTSFLKASNVHDRRIAEILQIIQRCPEIRAAELAPIVGLSTSRLHHLFKLQVGVSIGTYVKKIQLERARKLLLTTHRSLKEIRNEVGIADASNFVRHFKEWFGISPSAYRKQQKSRIDQEKAG